MSTQAMKVLELLVWLCCPQAFALPMLISDQPVQALRAVCVDHSSQQPEPKVPIVLDNDCCSLEVQIRTAVVRTRKFRTNFIYKIKVWEDDESTRINCCPAPSVS